MSTRGLSLWKLNSCKLGNGTRGDWHGLPHLQSHEQYLWVPGRELLSGQQRHKCQENTRTNTWKMKMCESWNERRWQTWLAWLWKMSFKTLAGNYLRSHARQLQRQLEGCHCENRKSVSRGMEQEGTDMACLTLKNVFELRAGNILVRMKGE